ncbi:protein kinase domain-containing protein [Singulisphaera sp. PoT]|uniref:serine/threonine-protein kinase n=1 Tax=Singulisphaera sp. PoT TaxID=3411797 RepID=UPI003BF6174C
MHVDACPSDETLTAFLLGDLPEPEIAAVREHQESCPACELRAQLLEGITDSVVDELRRVAPRIPGRDDEASPFEAIGGPGSSADPSGSPRNRGSYRLDIPGYEVDERPLGGGSMGVVYKARHIKLGRVVALKMIAEHSGETAALFQIEAKAVAQLQHSNIVQIFDIGQHWNRPFLALEFVEGGSLDQMLAGRPQPERSAAEMVATLASAVDYAHRQGIIHCDLKPSNILVTTERIPKIADFGVAKWVESDKFWGKGGEYRGTPRYMAPEQARGSVAVDDVGPRTDVYSLGVILYEMLTGRVPHLAETVEETLELVREQEPIPPSHRQPGISRDLDAITLKCLRKDPAGRYPDAHALAEDLNRFLDGEPIEGLPQGSIQRIYKHIRRRPELLTAPILIGAILLVYARDQSLFSVGYDVVKPPSKTSSEAKGTILVPLEVQNDGSIRLGASAAAVSGREIAFEHAFGNLGFWHHDDDHAWWTFHIKDESRFNVILEYANGNGRTGNKYQIRVNDAVLIGQALRTGNWADYQTFPVGELTLGAGIHRLEIRPVAPLNGPLFDVRAVILKPL